MKNGRDASEKIPNLRGVKLLGAVFAELNNSLSSEDISSEELLLAAQALIELSRKEYNPPGTREEQRHAGYFSYDVSRAIENFPLRIWLNENKSSEDDTLSPENTLNLRTLLHGRKCNFGWDTIDAKI